MGKPLLSVNALLAAPARTADGEAAPIVDLLLGTDDWAVRYLRLAAASAAPGCHAVLPVSAVQTVDRAGEVRLRLDAAALALASTVPAETDVLSFADAAQLQAMLAGADEAQPPGTGELRALADPSEADPGSLKAPSSAGQEAVQVAPDLISLSGLLAFGVETADGAPVRLMDMLLDRPAWRLAYLEVSVGPDAGKRIAERVQTATRCLVPVRGIDWVHRDARMLYLAVWADELRRAELVRHPHDDSGERRVRALPE